MPGTMSGQTARIARRPRRTGAALVEFAICLPVLIVLLLGTIEANSMIFLKQTLTIAAYEGGRTALLPGAVDADVTADCQQVITDRGIHNAQVVIDPTNIDMVAAGDYIAVQVTAPCDQNSLFSSWFYGGQTLAGRVEVMKEYD